MGWKDDKTRVPASFHSICIIRKYKVKLVLVSFHCAGRSTSSAEFVFELWFVIDSSAQIKIEHFANANVLKRGVEFIVIVVRERKMPLENFPDKKLT